MSNLPLHTQLSALGACNYKPDDAVPWSRSYGRAYKRAWLECERGDWLLWLCAKLDVDRRLIVRAVCACAREALQYVPGGEDRPRIAIETAEMWCDGSATLDDVRSAAAAAWAAAASAAADAAAYAAATRAADATRAAAYAAAYAADAAASAAADVLDSVDNAAELAADVDTAGAPPFEHGEGRCPDGGTCHHDCDPDGPCFRVLTCSPLSAYGDDWPPDVLAHHRELDRRDEQRSKNTTEDPKS